MKRRDLIKSPEYWTAEIQLQVFNLIEGYRKRLKLSKKDIAEKLGVSKGYITQILHGDFDHKVSKLVQLALAFDKVPIVHFIDVEKYIDDDAKGNSKIYRADFKPVEYITIYGSSEIRERAEIGTASSGTLSMFPKSKEFMAAQA